MSVDQIIATLRYVSQLYAEQGATRKATLLASFVEAIEPIGKADLETLVAVLNCGGNVDKTPR